MFTRILRVPQKSFFLLGPRATGKSTWTQAALPGATWFDLLRNDIFFPLSIRPETFREKVLGLPRSNWVVVDEVQRIPSLLNEVHSLIADGYRFALTGSSARKLKRGNANLLAGRALVLNLFPLTVAEYGDAIAVEEALAFGTLPSIIHEKATRIGTLDAYAGTYLREEIKEEALTRKVDSFGRFLEVASLANAQVTNLASLSRDSDVSRSTVTSYFEILQDTLILHQLEAFTPRARVKEVGHPKFYFFDCGVVRAIQGRLRDSIGPEERGHLLETLVHHELRAAIAYQDVGGKLYYWRTGDGVEIDFIWQRGPRCIAIEVKSSTRWKPEFDRGFAAISESRVKLTAGYGIYLGSDVLKKPWGTVYPVREFCKRLAGGKVLGR